MAQNRGLEIKTDLEYTFGHRTQSIKETILDNKNTQPENNTSLISKRDYLQQRRRPNPAMSPVSKYLEANDS